MVPLAPPARLPMPMPMPARPELAPANPSPSASTRASRALARRWRSKSCFRGSFFLFFCADLG